MKRGYSKRDIQHNIARELAAGTDPSAAVSKAYSMARDSALKAGNLERWKQLLPRGDDFTKLLMVGIGGMSLIGALPSDIARMTEDEALFELERLDSLQASRGLTPEEHKRLVNVELRLEQFVPEAQLKKAKDAEARAERGEQVVPEVVLRPGEKVIELAPVVVRTPSPAQVFIPIPTPNIAQAPKGKGMGVIGIVALAGLTYAVINKRSMFG